MEGCIFCRIVAGAAPSSRVYEDDRFLAFMDLHPIAAGHMLAIPKAHHRDLDDLPADLAGGLFQLGQRLSGAAKRSELGAEATNLLLNNGRAAMQTVFHAHLHVIPRAKGDGLRVGKGLALHLARLAGPKAGRGELDRLASVIAAGLRGD